MSLLAQRLIALVVTCIGVAGVIAMIVVEDEPGAIPLLVLVSGMTWLVVTQVRIRRGQRPPAGRR